MTRRLQRSSGWSAPSTSLLAGGERAPPLPADHAGKNNRLNVRKRAAPLVVGEEEGAAGNEAGSRYGGENGLDRHEAFI